MNTAEVHLTELSMGISDNWISVWGAPSELDKRHIYRAVDKVVSIMERNGKVNGMGTVLVINPTVRLYTQHWSQGGDDERCFR
jgi:hypothetical protein